jgi:hypothetical protein
MKRANRGMREIIAGALCGALLCFAGPAHSSPDPGAELEAERDALIGRIIKGADFAAAVRRFKELAEQRQRLIDAQQAQKEQDRAQRELERLRREQDRAQKDAYRKTADHEVSWRCTLSPDPAHPIPSNEGRFKGDWGKVVRKERVRLPPKNELDDGEEITLIEVAGAARRYLIRAERYGLPDGQPLRAGVGDLVLVCDGGSDIDGKLPPPFKDARVQTSGFAVKIPAPPRIAQKARWQPIHITGTRFYWAIRDVRWPYPPEAFVLCHIEIGADLGGGRFEIETNNKQSWVLEVPPNLPRRELVAPGRMLWVIMGKARFDRGIKKLVLTAEDVEERYVRE